MGDNIKMCLLVRFFLDKGHTDTDRLHIHVCQIDKGIKKEYARKQYLILGHYIFNFLGGRKHIMNEFFVFICYIFFLNLFLMTTPLDTSASYSLKNCPLKLNPTSSPVHVDCR